MKLRTLSLALSVPLFFTLQAFTQAQTEWRTYVDSDNEIWFQVPEGSLIHRESNPKSITLYAFANNASISITKQDLADKPINYVRRLSLPWGLKGSTTEKFELPTFLVRQEIEPMGNDRKLTLHAGSKQSYFRIVISASKTNPFVETFIQTIRFGGARLNTNPNVQDLAPSPTLILFDKLPNSPEVESSLSQKQVNATPESKFDGVKNYAPLDLDKLSRDLIVLEKPKAIYTDSARERNIQGIIPAEIEFRADGQIGRVIVDNRLDKSLAENVAGAARKIRFIPAQAGGKSIDIVRTLIYRFAIY